MIKNDVSRVSLVRALAFAGVAVTLLMTLYASTGGLFPGDTQISLAIQSVNASGADAVVSFMNAAYDAPTLVLITVALAVLLGVLGYYPQMVLLGATTVSQGANALLKLAVGRPRPEDGMVRVTEQASGLSFPSGHTMGTVVFFGIIIYLSYQFIGQRHLRLLVQVLAVAHMLAIGFSRVHTGAHWPSDVVGGFLWGAWFVLLLVICHRRYFPRLTSRLAAA
jgi:membrane-associated phospholipid phosphatase